ncbi:hypothetical protein [Sphingomonas sp.]|uniref:hypothetical protein n=1 Tax=Sphingomonas sp. TaxID=28214 RepID=UPI0035B41CF4
MNSPYAWLPIATAPRDGSWFFTKVEGEKEYPYDVAKFDIYLDDFVKAGCGFDHVTHWRPAEMAGADHGIAINLFTLDVHAAQVAAGWWSNLETGEPIKRDVGELLCLVHSEISEAMEGHRKSLMDDKLPHRPMIEVELADAIIRIADLAGGLGLDLGGAITEKMAYNAKREDHKLEVRRAAGGKAY